MSMWEWICVLQGGKFNLKAIKIKENRISATFLHNFEYLFFITVIQSEWPEWICYLGQSTGIQSNSFTSIISLLNIHTYFPAQIIFL